MLCKKKKRRQVFAQSFTFSVIVICYRGTLLHLYLKRKKNTTILIRFKQILSKFKSK